jgi:hypothetical protein
VFVSGVTYQPASSMLQNGDADMARGTRQRDPFAAAAVAAAAVAAAAAGSGAVTGSTAATATYVSKAVKQAGSGLTAAAVAGSSSQQQQQEQQQQQRQQLLLSLAAAGYCDLSQGYVSLPAPVAPGQTSCCTLQFGTIKSGVKSAAGELVLDELPAAFREAGWSVEPQKLSTPAGEKRPFVIRFTAPSAAKLQCTPAGALLGLGLPVQQTVQLGCTLKGGGQPGPGAGSTGMVPASTAADGSRRMTIICSCTISGT